MGDKVFHKETEWLDFVESVPNKPRKTKVISIISNSSRIVLGEIKWYGPWRQYCVFFKNKTIFNMDCFDAIQDVVNELNQIRNAEKNNG